MPKKTETISFIQIKNLEPSGIRKFFDVVNDMPDAISLGVGEPDFETPMNIRTQINLFFPGILLRLITMQINIMLHIRYHAEITKYKIPLL